MIALACYLDYQQSTLTSTCRFVYLVTVLQESVVRVLNPYVVGAFRLHSLAAATSIISSIIDGLFKIPLASLLDTWGRPQNLLVSVPLDHRVYHDGWLPTCRNVCSGSDVFIYWVGRAQLSADRNVDLN